jgi:hypothetical protein
MKPLLLWLLEPGAYNRGHKLGSLGHERLYTSIDCNEDSRQKEVHNIPS